MKTRVLLGKCAGWQFVRLWRQLTSQVGGKLLTIITKEMNEKANTTALRFSSGNNCVYVY